MPPPDKATSPGQEACTSCSTYTCGKRTRACARTTTTLIGKVSVKSRSWTKERLTCEVRHCGSGVEDGAWSSGSVVDRVVGVIGDGKKKMKVKVLSCFYAKLLPLKVWYGWDLGEFAIRQEEQAIEYRILGSNDSV